VGTQSRVCSVPCALPASRLCAADKLRLSLPALYSCLNWHCERRGELDTRKDANSLRFILMQRMFKVFKVIPDHQRLEF
jgi:hypothetical protein